MSVERWAVESVSPVMSVPMPRFDEHVEQAAEDAGAAIDA